MINYSLGLSFVMHNNEHNDQIFTAEVEKVISKLKKIVTTKDTQGFENCFFMIVVGLFT